MKYLALLLMVVFVLSALVQYNDPDGPLWMAAYLVAAYVSFRFYQGKINTEMVTVLLLFSLAWAAGSLLQLTAWEGFTTPGAGMAMKTPNQERAREAGGMLLVAAAYGVFLLGKRALK